MYTSGPTGTGTQRSVWEGSADGGQTFRVITPGPVPSAIQSIEDPPGWREGAAGRIYLAYLRDPAGNKICAVHRGS